MYTKKQLNYQVLGFFSHLKIFCFGASFYYKLQKLVMLRVVWMAWLFSQVITWFLDCAVNVMICFLTIWDLE